MEEITGSNCDCPEPCSKIAFEPSQSSAIISKQNSETLLGDTRRLKEKFLKARDTQDHVIKNTYVNDLKLVMNISKNYKRLHNYVHGHVMKESDNARFKQILDVLNFFSTGIVQDRNDYFLGTISRFIGAYEEKFLLSRELLWNAIDASVQKIFLIEEYRLKTDDIESMLPEAISLLDMTQNRLIAYDQHISNDVGNSRVTDLPVSLKDVFNCASYSGSATGSGGGNYSSSGSGSGTGFSSGSGSSGSGTGSSSGSGYGSSGSGTGSSSGSGGSGSGNCLSCVGPLVDVLKDLQSAYKQGYFAYTYKNSIKTLKVTDKTVRTCLDTFYDKLLSFRRNAYSAVNRYYDNLEDVLIQAKTSIDLDELFTPMRASQLRYCTYIILLNYKALYRKLINSDSQL